MSTAPRLPGERSIATVGQTRSRSVRLQRRLAMVVVGAFGAGILGWYYVHLASESKAAAVQQRAATGASISTEMRLPALGATHPVMAAPKSLPAPLDIRGSTGAQGQLPPTEATGAAQGADSPRAFADAGSDLGRRSSANTSSVVLRADVQSPSAQTGARFVSDPRIDELQRLAFGQQPSPAPAAASALSGALAPTVTAAAEASLVPTRRWLLPKGSFLDCTLETAIDSTLPGMATCMLAVDAFGADGRLVLLERGTKLVGETRADVRSGQARVSVLWSEARTPTGVTVNLASPAADSLGRTGAPGDVDNHFGARFGAAVLLSVIDGAISAVVAHEQGSAGVVYNPQSSRDVATEALRGTIAIPPTINVPAGARVQVIVARDIDFRKVYSVVPRTGS